MKKNVAGQKIGAQLVSATDGAAFTSAVTVYITKDAGVQAIGSVGSGACVHEGNGYHTYAPSQSETNGDLIAFTFTGTGAVPVTVQVAHASEVWDVDYSLHKIAGTFGKLMDILRKANTAIEATITADVTPTASTFSVDLTTYPTDAFANSVLMMIDGNRIDQNAPVLSFTNNTTFSTIVLESPLTGAPAVGDTILIDAISHVHSVAEIVTGVWSALTSGLSVVGSTGRALARLIGLVEDSGGDRFTAKALEESPAGGGGAGDASQETLLQVKAKTDLITSQTANQQQTPVNQMVIIRGDSYSGATRKTHAVTTDYTGYAATFTIRHRVTDAVLLTCAGAVDSSTQLSVTLTTTNTAFPLLVDPTEFGPHPYDFRLVSGAIEKTESGIAIIRRDITRA